MTEILQESRTERATMALTPAEKQALRWLREHVNKTESDLLRDNTIGDLVAWQRSLSAATPAGDPPVPSTAQ